MARLQQVGVIVNITKPMLDVCAIAGINTGKSLVYYLILIIIDGSMLVILSTIAPIKD